jgi:XTP/dITP diphosphohydrolase
MNQLLIATNNTGKVKEFHELLKETGIELVMPAAIGLNLEVTEDGQTYAENAAKKATAFAQASGLISLADDSGLEVDVLDGAPGLFSARYGSTDGEKLSDAGRRQYLLAQLKGKPRPWTARFHATIAIAIPEPRETQAAYHTRRVRRSNVQDQAPALHIFEGCCEGEIIPEERGFGGFGYDPIFLLPELGKTMAELSLEEKNRLSHRARAVMNARETIKTVFAMIG